MKVNLSFEKKKKKESAKSRISPSNFTDLRFDRFQIFNWNAQSRSKCYARIVANWNEIETLITISIACIR